MKCSPTGRPAAYGRAGRGLALVGLSFAVGLSTHGVAAGENGDASGGTDGVAMVCTSETYTWTGTATVADAADVVSTGISVAAQLGARLVVVGTSADGLDAGGHAVALPVSIGAVGAQQGAVVDAGGAIAIHGPVGGSTSGPLTVNGATVVIDRCVEVASAAESPVPPTSVVSDAGALSPTTVAAASPASDRAALPSTGSSSTVPIVAFAGGLVAIGLVLRRSVRATAPAITGRDLAPGSRRGVRPPDPR